MNIDIIDIVIFIISIIISLFVIVFINKDKFTLYCCKKEEIILPINNIDDNIQIIIDANKKYKKEDEIELL